jgi:hypothetical protein
MVRWLCRLCETPETGLKKSSLLTEHPMWPVGLTWGPTLAPNNTRRGQGFLARWWENRSPHLCSITTLPVWRIQERGTYFLTPLEIFCPLWPHCSFWACPAEGSLSLGTIFLGNRADGQWAPSPLTAHWRLGMAAICWRQQHYRNRMHQEAVERKGLFWVLSKLCRFCLADAQTWHSATLNLSKILG